LSTIRLLVSPTLTRVFLLAAVLALAALLAGCSSTDDVGGSDSGDATSSAQTSPAVDETPNASSNSGGDEVDACAILLPQDVEAEIGVAPPPSSDPVGQFQSCGYFDTGTTFVQFQACRCLTGSQFDDSAKAGADALEVELKEVEGVGDKAYWYAGILWVTRGDVSFNLWISKPSYYTADGTALDGDALDAVAIPDAKALALTLLGRLP
jgi:hypothetical protein